MEKFEASNGVKIGRNAGVQLMAHGNGLITAYVIGAHERALREFFLHEQGIWRDEETGQLVIEFGGDALVIDGAGARRERWTREEAGDDGHSWVFGYAAAGRYFAAHPESKPWHDAKPGEAWLLTLEGCEEGLAATFDFDGVTHFARPGADDVSVNYDLIAAAHRVWPEAVSDG